ncbi:hypothetical protein GCM10009662_40530 [Catellatospora coxensis]|uniref:Uncharacterized protein n=1 Tax=Catellatospora coxensis TaxID=310354 RepID=A0A8J3KZH4_9ACTN|nr:hypothetical protein Cco03nite_58570 [Catellatospora coxensis]
MSTNDATRVCSGSVDCTRFPILSGKDTVTRAAATAAGLGEAAASGDGPAEALLGAAGGAPSSFGEHAAVNTAAAVIAIMTRNGGREILMHRLLC